MILADGWDELAPPAQEQATGWLADLANALPGNLWVVAVGAQRYAPLAHAGFVPLRLLLWDHPEVRDFLTRLPTPENFPLERAAEDLTRVLKRTNSLLDVALCAGWLLENGAVPPRRMDPFRRRLEKWAAGLPDPSAGLEGAPATDPLDILRALARQLQEEGRSVCSRQEVEELIRRKLLPPLPSAAAPAEDRGAHAAGPVPQEGAPLEEPAPERPSAPEPQLPRAALASFTKAFLAPGGPLIACASNRYRFAHPLWQAMLTAEALASSPDGLVAHLDDPFWLPWPTSTPRSAGWSRCCAPGFPGPMTSGRPACGPRPAGRRWPRPMLIGATA